MHIIFSPSRPSIGSACPADSAFKLGKPVILKTARKTARNAIGGFSLMEVVLALGVVAFAFVALFGMLPVGLNAFNNSIDATQETQIAENVMSQLRQAKFSTLYAQFNDTQAGTITSPNNAPSFFKPYSTHFIPPAPGFYFDDQGNPATLISSGSTVPNPVASGTSQGLNYVYSAGVQVYYDSWSVQSGNVSTPPFNTPPSGSTVASTSVSTTTPQPVATVFITITKQSASNVARVYTGFIGNNGF